MAAVRADDKLSHPTVIVFPGTLLKGFLSALRTMSVVNAHMHIETVLENHVGYMLSELKLPSPSNIPCGAVKPSAELAVARFLARFSCAGYGRRHRGHGGFAD